MSSDISQKSFCLFLTQLQCILTWRRNHFQSWYSDFVAIGGSCHRYSGRGTKGSIGSYSCPWGLSCHSGRVWKIWVTSQDVEPECWWFTMPGQGINPDILCSNIPVKQVSHCAIIVSVTIEDSWVTVPSSEGIRCPSLSIYTSWNIVSSQPSLTSFLTLCKDTTQQLWFLKVHLDPWLTIITTAKLQE